MRYKPHMSVRIKFGKKKHMSVGIKSDTKINRPLCYLSFFIKQFIVWRFHDQKCCDKRRAPWRSNYWKWFKFNRSKREYTNNFVGSILWVATQGVILTSSASIGRRHSHSWSMSSEMDSCLFRAQKNALSFTYLHLTNTYIKSPLSIIEVINSIFELIDKLNSCKRN